MTLHEKLIHAATVYDRKQATRRGYNPYALGQYFMRIDEVCRDVAAGAPPRQAIAAGSTGRLLDVMLKAAQLEKSTDAEQRGNGAWSYSPVTAKD